MGAEHLAALTGTERGRPPTAERGDRPLEAAPVRRQLVDGGRGGRRELRPRQDARPLELAQARREDVRADAGEAVEEVGEALRA